jgi:hypothetical protein
MGFVCRDDFYKISREGPCPFWLSFVRNDKIMVFKDLGPDHWQRSKLS